MFSAARLKRLEAPFCQQAGLAQGAMIVCMAKQTLGLQRANNTDPPNLSNNTNLFFDGAVERKRPAIS
jgi:hypothetical protein